MSASHPEVGVFGSHNYLAARLVAVAAGVWLMAAPAVLGYGGLAESNDRIVGPIAAACAFVACWEIMMSFRWATLPLGTWLVIAPLLLGYDDTGAWVSSVVAGTVIAATAFVGYDTRTSYAGGWRSVGPSAWRTEPNDRTDDAPGKERDGSTDVEAPPGWTTNPSAWSQRIPIVVLAVVGGIAATWLALYQQGFTDVVFEPFFGDGTRAIVRESSFSEAFERFPIGDAAIGALGYLADAVTGVIGGTERWRTMPWIVVIFGAFVGPFGAISVMLTIFQPVLYDSFCTLCLVSGAISLAMIGPGVDEVLASLQHMRRERAGGASTWRVFWGLAQ